MMMMMMSYSYTDREQARAASEVACIIGLLLLLSSEQSWSTDRMSSSTRRMVRAKYTNFS